MSKNRPTFEMIEIDGYTLPDCVIVTRCSQCGALLLTKDQPKDAMQAIRRLIEVHERPPAAIRAGKEVFCCQCIADVRGPNGERCSSLLSHSRPGKTVSRIDWRESGSSDDDVSRAMEEDR